MANYRSHPLDATTGAAKKMTNAELQDAINAAIAAYDAREHDNISTELYKQLCSLLNEQRRRAQEKQS